MRDHEPRPLELGVERKSDGWWQDYRGPQRKPPWSDTSIVFDCPECGTCLTIGDEIGSTAMCNKLRRQPDSNESIMCAVQFRVEATNGDKKIQYSLSEARDSVV